MKSLGRAWDSLGGRGDDLQCAITLERAARAVRGKHVCSREKNASEADFEETRSQDRHAGVQASQPTIQSAGWRTPDARAEACPGLPNGVERSRARYLMLAQVSGAGASIRRLALAGS